MSGYISYRSSCLLKLLRKQLFPLRNLATEVNVLKSPGNNLNLPRNVLVQDYVLDKIEKWDNKVALECIETGRRCTYSDLKRKSLVLAHFLRNSLKLEEKDCVAIFLPNLPEFTIVFLGILQAGLTVTTINPQYRQDEIKRQLAHSKVKALFILSETGQEAYAVARSLKIPIISLKLKETSTLPNDTISFYDILNTKPDLSRKIDISKVAPDSIALLPYSSGTTGVSKGVELTHNNLVSNLEQVGDRDFYFCQEKDEVVLAFLPFFHIYGLVFVLLHMLCQGAKLITFPKFTSQSFITSLKKCRPTFIPSAPPVVHLIMNNPEIKREDIASVRTLLSGAAPLQASDIERFSELSQGRTDLLQAYGMTELSPVATVQTKNKKGGYKIGGSGLLVPNTEAKFVSQDDTSSLAGLGPNKSGELHIRGPQVMKGYLNNPEATKETLSEDGWLKTGDIGHYDEDGHIFITDRLKDLIKVKGFQVAPAELEAVLRNHPLIEDVGVIGVPHKLLGEAPKAYVVPRKDSRVTPDDVKEFLASKVADFKQLAGGVVFLESIPKNPSGKILRKELRNIS